MKTSNLEQQLAFSKEYLDSLLRAETLGVGGLKIAEVRRYIEELERAVKNGKRK